jgi:hypothetical protein
MWMCYWKHFEALVIKLHCHSHQFIPCMWDCAAKPCLLNFHIKNILIESYPVNRQATKGDWLFCHEWCCIKWSWEIFHKAVNCSVDEIISLCVSAYFHLENCLALLIKFDMNVMTVYHPKHFFCTINTNIVVEAQTFEVGVTVVLLDNCGNHCNQNYIYYC